jgi:outer membrane protein assembly factor BamB
LKATKRLVRWQTLALLSILALVLVGCGPNRHGVSWPSLDLVTVDEQPLVLVTYNTQTELIDPYLGGARYNAGQNADGQPSSWIISGANYNNVQFYVSPIASSEDGRDTLIFPTYSNENHRLLEFYKDTALPVNTAGYVLSGDVVADVVLGDDLIYLGYRHQDLVALNAENFQEVWRLDTNAGVWASPLLHEGVLYVPSVDHFLYAVDAVTGQLLWQVDLEGGISATPLFYNDYLYLGSFSHKLFKISLNGEIVASYEGNSWLWSTPIVSGMTATTSELTVIEEATAEATRASEEATEEAPIVEEDDNESSEAEVLYYSDLAGYVYAINPGDMSLIWQAHPAGQGIRPAPMLINGFLVVASRDGIVYWLDPSTGTTVQSAEFKDRAEMLSDMLYLPADEANNRPALLLVASTDPGKLITAFNLETFTQQWVYNR